MIKEQSPWAEEIEAFGEINFDKLLYLLTGFRNIPKDKFTDFDELEGLIDRLGQGNLTTLMRKVMPSCSEFLRRCWWRGELKNCSDLFDVRKTDDGFCCSFNTLDQSQNLDISLVVQSSNSIVNGLGGLMSGLFGSIFDGGDYIDDEPLTTREPEVLQPEIEPVVAEDESTEDPQISGSLKKGLDILSKVRVKREDDYEDYADAANTTANKRLLQKLRRSNSASYLLGLTVLMDAKSEDYFVSNENYVGFKVMAHNPRTFPEVSSQGTIIDSGKEAFFAVSAVYTESSLLVRDLEVERRNCIFADEKNVPNAKITVFKFYSQVCNI